ncbi:MAG: imidazole glycerol phosphate synthase subunit HisH [Alphaproteobacteria bacterium]|nr:imidazole glycerol phosphate synthase subunit HisH [Alphaproteobacteria bacterium]
MADVLILPTGTANLASVEAAFKKLGASTVRAEDPKTITEAARVVLPGVGAFGATMAGLRAKGFAKPIAERVQAGKPTLSMCVGLQVLFETSDESPEAQGLSVIEGKVGRFPDQVSVPQFGWNHIQAEAACRYLESGYAYFANGFRVQAAPGCRTATSRHGEPFVAALERDDVVACQFHPELSGAFGHRLIRRWLEG